MKPFADSDFVVTFYGEAPDSRVIRTWDKVLAYIDYAVGAEGDGWSCRSEDCSLHDPDNWHLLHWSEGKDDRHTFHEAEFTYCVGLSIIRLTEDIPATILGSDF